MSSQNNPCTTETLEPRTLLSTIPYPSGFGPLQARLVAAVDFTADGQKDLLWQDHNTGEVYIEVVTDTTNPTPTYTKHLLGIVDPNKWVLEGATDFDGDASKPDLLWFNTETRRPAQWLIVGLQPTGFRWMNTNSVAEGWRIEGTGNFDGDADASDIVWRNYLTGHVAIWEVSFDTPVGFTIFQGPETANWALELADDFNGDSKPDLLWRNYATGKQCVWFMDNTTVTGCQMLNRFHTVPQVWDIEGRGDFNSDLWDDIVYRNYVTGEVVAWLMQNTVKIGERVLMTRSA